jgi:hypothetical protein
MKLLYGWLVCAGLTLGGIAWGDGNCPDEMATHVAANEVPQGLVHECRLSIFLWGLRIEIEGPDCYETILHFPEHSYCDNAHNEGTMCVEKTPLPVMKETCQCGISLFGIHVFLPLCTCTDEGERGTCPNADTESCPIVIHPH